MLKKQNEQMAHRVAELEKRTAGADSARLDKAIEDAHLRMQYQKMKIAEATKVGDGTALADAQETTGMTLTVEILILKLQSN